MCRNLLQEFGNLSLERDPGPQACNSNLCFCEPNTAVLLVRDGSILRSRLVGLGNVGMCLADLGAVGQSGPGSRRDNADKLRLHDQKHGGCKFRRQIQEWWTSWSHSAARAL